MSVCSKIQSFVESEGVRQLRYNGQFIYPHVKCEEYQKSDTMVKVKLSMRKLISLKKMHYTFDVDTKNNDFWSYRGYGSTLEPSRQMDELSITLVKNSRSESLPRNAIFFSRLNQVSKESSFDKLRAQYSYCIYQLNKMLGRECE